MPSVLETKMGVSYPDSLKDPPNPPIPDNTSLPCEDAAMRAREFFKCSAESRSTPASLYLFDELLLKINLSSLVALIF